MRPVTGILISYDRTHQPAYARALRSWLVGLFGRVLLGSEESPRDAASDGAIDQAAGRCDCLLVVVGEECLSLNDTTGGRCSDNPKDIVGREIEAAARFKHRIILVLVGGAAEPRPGDLSPSLSRLPSHETITLRDMTWEADMRVLTDALLAGTPIPAQQTPAPASRTTQRSWLRRAFDRMLGGLAAR